MGKLWFAFSERARDESAKGLILGAVLVSGLLSPWTVAPVYAESNAAPSVQASPGPTHEPDILLLPAFDLERVTLSSGPAASSAGSESPPEAVSVGDHVTLKVVGLHLPGIKNPAKDLTLEVPAAVNLRDQGWDISTPPPSKDSSVDREVNTSEFILSASPLKPGKLTLPSLILKNSTGNAVGRTNPFNLEVVSAIRPNDPKPEQPEDLEPPVGLRFPWWIVAGAALLVLLGVGAGVYALVRWRKRKKADAKKVPEIVRSEDETALMKLEELEKMALIQRGEFKAYYFGLSEILKAYVGGRYRFEAPECTTREMLSTLEEKKAVADFVVDQLEKMFERLDLVKFTDHFPAMEEPALLIQEARQFVVSTRKPRSVMAESAGSHEVR